MPAVAVLFGGSRFFCTFCYASAVIFRVADSAAVLGEYKQRYSEVADCAAVYEYNYKQRYSEVADSAAVSEEFKQRYQKVAESH